MAEIIQHYYKDEDIQFEIIVRSKSLKCNSAINDMSEEDKDVVKSDLRRIAKEIAPIINYTPK